MQDGQAVPDWGFREVLDELAYHCVVQRPAPPLFVLLAGELPLPATVPWPSYLRTPRSRAVPSPVHATPRRAERHGTHDGTRRDTTLRHADTRTRTHIHTAFEDVMIAATVHGPIPISITITATVAISVAIAITMTSQRIQKPAQKHTA